MRERQQSSTSHPLTFFMASSTDHVTGVTGITPTVTLSKDGAAFGAAAGAVSEIGNGWYALAGNATDRNTLGALNLHATGTGADPFDGSYTIVPWDPFDSVRMGLTALPNAAAGANGGLPTVNGSNQVAGVAADVGITQAGADKVWASAARTLTSFGTLVADIWASATRTLTAFGFSVAVSDKSGFSLASGEHVAIAADVQTGLTAQGYTSTRAGFLDVLNGLVAAIWNAATRTLSAFGFNVTVATNNDKTGYALAATPPTAAQIRQEMDANSAVLARLLGLSRDNLVYRDLVFDTDGNLTSAVMRLYDTAGHAATDDGTTGLVGSYGQVSTYSGGRMTKTTVTRLS